jgi:hypothetical protein
MLHLFDQCMEERGKCGEGEMEEKGETKKRACHKKEVD